MREHHVVRITLDMDDDVLHSARTLAVVERRPLGTVISELARRDLDLAWIEVEDDLPVIRVPDGSPVITAAMVVRALCES